MSEKMKKIYAIALPALAILFLSVWALLREPDDYSLAERRELKSFPEVSIQSIFSGSFMDSFEDYSLDQFPLRDSFRSLKAFTSLKIMGQKDSNGYYIHDGYIGKLEYPLSDVSLNWAGEVFQGIYDSYLANSDTNIYFSIVPDKNYYLADAAGALYYDYDELYSRMYDMLPWAQTVDIREYLSLEDYYKTDTHWRQECLTDVANALAVAMGAELPDSYETVDLDQPFKGVYYSQLGLELDTEQLSYLTNDIIDDFSVYNHEKKQRMPVYNISKANSRDPYEMFLSGAVSLISITNPNAETDRELVIFRDSFGSAISPLLAQGYAKTTIVDLRYIQPAYLGNFINFENQDVLFLYSSLVLNSSSALKR